eukprot:gene27957-16221_t
MLLLLAAGREALLARVRREGEEGEERRRKELIVPVAALMSVWLAVVSGVYVSYLVKK